MDNHEDRGWVKPVGQSADTAFMDPIEPVGSTIRSSVIGGIILVSVVVAAIAGVLLWRGRNGDPLASARSVPAEMDFVMTFDALALSDSERLQSFVDAFALPMVEAGVIDDYPDDLVLAIDEAMDEAGGYTLTDDILPWIGRSVSIAASVPEVDMATAEVDALSFLVSADVRDSDAAGAFLDEVLADLASEGVEIAAASFGGSPGYRWDDSNEDIAIGVVLTEESLLFGMANDVSAAVAARESGLSVADDAAFRDAMNRLPDERLMSVFVASSAVDGFLDIAETGLAGTEVGFEGAPFTAAAASVSLVDEGVRFSYVMIGGEAAEGSLVPHESVLAGLPDGTLAYVSVAASGTVAQQSRGADTFEELQQPLDELSAQLGIDVRGVLESLSGDMTLAVAESRAGMIAAETDVPVGVVGALGLTDPGPLGELIGLLEELLGEQGATLDIAGGVTTVAVDGQQLFSYAATDDLAVIGTGPMLVDRVIAGAGGGVLESALYRELDSGVAGDGLVMFADIGRIVGLIPLTTDEAAMFAPLRGVGFGGEVSGDALEMEVMILVDY